MEPITLRGIVKRGMKSLGRLALAASLFALLAPTPASSAPQPEVCKSAAAGIHLTV
ncbi:MAG TPA: hypothetical protein VFA34_01110 [Actinomycetota bacterium]|jgi:hypothetical protein|nr:hypothetical protein [Actinomycetota bacterium]